MQPESRRHLLAPAVGTVLKLTQEPVCYALSNQNLHIRRPPLKESAQRCYPVVLRHLEYLDSDYHAKIMSQQLSNYEEYSPDMGHAKD